MRLASSRRAAVVAVLFASLGLVGCASAPSNPAPSTRPAAMRPVPKMETENGFAGFWHNVTGAFSGNTPIKFVRMMEDQSRPDHRRLGIYELVKRDFGQREPYTARYRQIAQTDGDFTVRAAAIRALNWSRDSKAVPVFIAGLNDANELVRWEAAKALANVPDPSAVDPLTRTLTSASETGNVKVAAAAALRHYHTAPVARTLIGTLNGRDFGVAWQARRSLREITGRDLRYDDRAWLQYLASPERPLS